MVVGENVLPTAAPAGRFAASLTFAVATGELINCETWIGTSAEVLATLVCGLTAEPCR